MAMLGNVGLVVLLWSSFGWAAEWRVGIARTDVTPAKLLWMAGYAARKHPPERTLHALWAKALVIEDQRGQRVAIVTTDLIGDEFGRETSDGVGVRVQERTGIARERIVFNFSHTHCGPVTRVSDGALVTYPLSAQQQADVRESSQTLRDKLVKLIEEACVKMRPAELAYGEGEAMKYFGLHGPFQPGVEERVVGLVERLMER
jgi:hypothetical protein